jgi:hypothetical protein
MTMPLAGFPSLMQMALGLWCQRWSTSLGSAKDEYLEAPEAQVAIAAAAMVASARDGDLSSLSFEDDRKAFSKHQHALT